MSSITTNIQQSEQHGVKIWTMPNGRLGFSIFFPFSENETMETISDKTKQLYEKLKETFNVIGCSKDDKENIDDLNITISNDNKDSKKHVTISGIKDPNILLKQYEKLLAIEE